MAGWDGYPVDNVMQRQAEEYSKNLIGQRLSIGSLIWRILDANIGQALVISENVIETRPFNERFKETTWAECTLRSYLNGEFLDIFNEDEKRRIGNSLVMPSNNPWYPKAKAGVMTNDKVFLLGVEQVAAYFGDSGLLKNRPMALNSVGEPYTEEELAEFIEVSGSLDAAQEHIQIFEYQLSDRYNYERTAEYADGSNAWWWLRTPGDGNMLAVFVNGGGVIYMEGSAVSGVPYEACGRDDNLGGVRPAMWITPSESMIMQDNAQPVDKFKSGMRAIAQQQQCETDW